MKWAFLLVASLLVGCASDVVEDAGEGDIQHGFQTFGVDIDGFQFQGGDMTIQVGDAVRWRNLESTPHTVTSTDGGPLNSGTLQIDDDYKFVFDEVGEYPYKCNFHSSMTGTITVVQELP